MSASDDRLIRNARAGRQQACTELVRRYQGPVFALISRLVGDPAVAAQLAHDTFIKAFRRLDSFDQRRQLSVWLLRIAHNTAIDQLRRSKPQSAGVTGDGGASGPGPAPALSGPDRHTRDRLALRDLAQAMARLRLEHRLALELRVDDGHSYEQIAYIMGVAEGTAKSYVQRARHQLADEMRRAGWGTATDAAR